MKKVIPYKTSRNALAALDNGGRFYNLLTKADDGQVSASELSKVAGAFSSRQKMVLYLEMSTFELDKSSAKQIQSALSDKLKSDYKKYYPQRLLPSEAELKGQVGSNAIVTGIPKYVKSNTDFNGFIMIPISTGKTTTFAMIPLIDQYDVYEIKDTATSKEFLIAHTRSSTKLSEQMVRCGGVLKELSNGKEKNAGKKKFLESVYYSVV